MSEEINSLLLTDQHVLTEANLGLLRRVQPRDLG